VLAERIQRLDVLWNDTQGQSGFRIVEVTQPVSGSARIVDGEIEVDIDPALAVTQTLEYVIVDAAGGRDTATVTLVAFGQAAELPVATMIDVAADDDGSDEVASVDQPSANVLERILPELGVPAGFMALVDLELPLLGLSIASLWIVGILLATHLWMRRSRYVVVNAIDRGDELDDEGQTFRFRHDAYRVWSTGRRSRRRGMMQVETPNGHRWIAADKALTEEYSDD